MDDEDEGALPAPKLKLDDDEGVLLLAAAVALTKSARVAKVVFARESDCWWCGYDVDNEVACRCIAPPSSS